MIIQLPQNQENIPNSIIDNKKLLEIAIENSKKNNFGLPERFKNKNFLNFEGFEDKIELAKKAILNNSGVFIYGDCGTGKTHIACALMRLWYQNNFKIVYDEFSFKDVVQKPVDPYFLPSVEFFLNLKETFSKDNSETENSYISKLSNIPLLIIDDVGAEKVSDWSRQTFYTLIDRRYRQMKQTIITSNLSLDNLAKNIDDRITSRIIEMCEIVSLGKIDYRLKTKNKS